MNSLESRKRILIAESELNRAQLVQEWQTMADGVRSVTDRAKSFGSIASIAAVWVAGLAAIRRSKFSRPGEKPSWWQTILKGAGMVSTLWLAFRAKGHDQQDK